MNILQKAQQLVEGDRQKDYDSPDKNFQRTANLWNGYLDSIGDRKLTPNDIAMMMVLLKISREIYKHKEDSVVDAVGYLYCLYKIAEPESQ